MWNQGGGNVGISEIVDEFKWLQQIVRGANTSRKTSDECLKNNIGLLMWLLLLCYGYRYKVFLMVVRSCVRRTCGSYEPCKKQKIDLQCLSVSESSEGSSLSRCVVFRGPNSLTCQFPLQIINCT